LGNKVEHSQESKDFFHTIYLAIEDPQLANRPIMVFFTDDAMLMDFDKQCPAFTGSRSKFTLKSSTGDDLRANLIAQAGDKGRVTLVARSYGRGSDFISHSKEVERIGGLHVIQTFISESEVEEHQLRGRTARQDQPGSYQQVLWQSELLSHFNKEPTYDFKEGEVRMNNIAELVGKKVASRFQQIDDAQEKQKEKWETTKELQRHITADSFAKAQQSLVSLAS